MLELLIIINMVFMVTLSFLCVTFFKKSNITTQKETVSVVRDVVNDSLDNLEMERGLLQSKLDNFIDLMNTTKESLNKNLDAFCLMLEDVQKNEGYYDTTIIQQVENASSILKNRINDIYQNLVTKASNETD